MKRILALILVLSMAFALSACGSSSSSTSAPAATQAPAAAPAENPAPTEEPEPEIHYPTQAIRVIVPYGAGGNTDLNARIIAEIATQNNMLPNGQAMIVTNVTGANTANAIEAVLDADPDGYTVLMHQTAMLAQYNLGNIETTYTDFTCVAQVFESPLIVSARMDAPFDTLEECVAYAKEHPGEVTWAHTGVGQSSFLATEALLSNYHGEDIHEYFKILAYTGGADSSAAQLGGDIMIRVGSALDTMQYVESGDIKLLCVSGSERLPLAPDTPCYKDLGCEENFALHQGYFVRKDTPQEVVDILSDIIFQAISTDEYKEFCKNAGGFARNKTGAEFAATLEAVNSVVKEICDNAQK